MTTKEMKNILVNKFEDENCCFTRKDVSIRKSGKTTTIIIKDYEHITFKITEDYDDYLGYELYVNEFYTDYPDETEWSTFTDSKTTYNYETALKLIGYHIAQTF